MMYIILTLTNKYKAIFIATEIEHVVDHALHKTLFYVINKEIHKIEVLESVDEIFKLLMGDET